MSAEAAGTAAPSYAVLMWADERNIYAQIPGGNGPYVAAFSRSEGGLSQALHTLGAMHKDHAEAPYLRPALPPAKLLKDGLNQNDLERARDVLKKLGVIG